METTPLQKLVALVAFEALYQLGRSAPFPLAIVESRSKFCAACAMIRFPAWLRLIA